MTQDKVLEIGIEGKYLENLWLNVIIQSFADISTKIDTGECALNKQKADEWMDLENNKFLMVCSLANINPKKVIKIKKRLLKNGRSFRIFKIYH